MILRRGAIVEMGETQKVFGNPQHSYTQSLLTAVPQLHRTWERTDVAALVGGRPPMGPPMVRPPTRCKQPRSSRPAKWRKWPPTWVKTSSPPRTRALFEGLGQAARAVKVRCGPAWSSAEPDGHPRLAVGASRAAANKTRAEA